MGEWERILDRYYAFVTILFMYACFILKLLLARRVDADSSLRELSTTSSSDCFLTILFVHADQVALNTTTTVRNSSSACRQLFMKHSLGWSSKTSCVSCIRTLGSSSKPGPAFTCCLRSSLLLSRMPRLKILRTALDIVPTATQPRCLGPRTRRHRLAYPRLPIARPVRTALYVIAPGTESRRARPLQPLATACADALADEAARLEARLVDRADVLRRSLVLVLFRDAALDIITASAVVGN